MSEEKSYKNILIVEDEQIFRDILNAELSKEGFNIRVASNGEEGLAELKKEAPDLVLLDIVMPKRDGFSVLSEMKKDEKLRQVPVIVLSNSGDIVELNWAKKLGAREVLVKADFGPKDLLAKLKRFFEELERGGGSAAAAEAGGESQESGGPFHILITEDEPDLQGLLKLKLEHENCKVTVAGTGGEALSKAVEMQPDLVLLDLVLPDKDGFEVLQEMKAENATAKIPVIVLSNLGQQGDVSKALDMGADDYLIKAHHTPQEIVEKIRKYWG